MMLCLGNFIGPTVSGFTVEAYGFEWTSVFFFGLSLLLVVINILTFIYDLRNFKPGSDCESRCVSHFLPTGMTVTSRGNNETKS